MGEADRQTFAELLDRITRTEFSAKKRDAYRAAGVSPTTWDRGLDAQPLRADRYAAIVTAFFPSAEGDWRVLDVFGGNVSTRKVALTPTAIADVAAEIETIRRLSDRSIESLTLDFALRQIEAEHRDDAGMAAFAGLRPFLPNHDQSMDLNLAWARLHVEAAREMYERERAKRAILMDGREDRVLQWADELQGARSRNSESEVHVKGSQYDEAALQVDPSFKGANERQADDQDAAAHAPDPEGPEGGA